MRPWLSAIAALTLVLVGSPSVHAQEELTVSIVSRGDDGFRELIFSVGSADGSHGQSDIP